MNNTQVTFTKYITDPARTRVPQMMEDLTGRGFFESATEKTSTEILTKYLDENPRSFCQEGIERARKANNIVPKPVWKARTEKEEGSKVTEKDFANIPVGSGVEAKGKNHLVLKDGKIASQVDGSHPDYASTETFEIVYLAD